MEFIMKTTCPDEETLVDYLEGRLSDADRAEVEEHISRCEICLENLLVARNLLKDSNLSALESVPLQVTDAAVRLVTRRGRLSYAITKQKQKAETMLRVLRSGVSNLFTLEPWGKFAFAPTRGSKKMAAKDSMHVKKTFKDILVDIEIEKTGDEKALIRVTLPENTKNKKGIRVTLKRGEREISSNLAGEGYVLFEDIPFGTYGITFERDGTNLGIYFFEFKEKDFKRKGK
jgi:hypothetical protein